MPSRRTDQDVPGPTLSDLQTSIEQLAQRMAVLTDAVDQLFDELQWRNNERRRDREIPSPPPVLRSMPSDPTTDDWRINRVSGEEVARLRQQLTGPTTPAELPQQSAEQLCREIAELKQIVSALILIVADVSEFGAVYDWIIEWASQEFDQELLGESLAIKPAMTTLAKAATISPPAAHQQALFVGDADAT